jgi:PAS domain S-box-containing protein
MHHPPLEPVTLDDILITELLAQRSPRTSDWRAEAEAMQPLAQQMARDAGALLQTLVDIALNLCQAGTAGVSLLETTPDGTEIFRWTTMAGRLSQAVGGSTPRNFSPCGVCLDRGTPQLFSHPERYFSYFQDTNTPIVEGLVLPLISEHQALGTLWIMSHDEQRQFDAEDVRVMTNLANFSAAALLLNQRQTQELLVANMQLETEAVERQRSHDALRESENHLKLVLEASLAGSWSWDVVNNVSIWDDRFHEVYGFAADAPRSYETWINGVHPEDRSRVQELTTQLFEDLNTDLWDQEFRLLHPTLGERWVQGLGRVERDADSTVLKFTGLNFDITDRKHAEAQLHHAAEMDAFRVKLSDALQSLSDSVEIQAEACRLLGEQLSVDRAYYVDVDIAKNCACVNQDYLRGDSPSLVGIHQFTDFGWIVPYLQRGETVIVANTQSSDIIPDGDRAAMAAIKILSHISLPLIKAGALVGALCVTESIPRQWSAVEVELVRETAERIWATIARACAEADLHASEMQRMQEQSAREEERNRAEYLAELDRAKTQFFSNISHEFRTPLTLILGPISEALATLEEAPQAQSKVTSEAQHLQDQLHIAQRNGLRLLKLVNTLLDFSRIEADRLQAHYQPTDLATYTTELASVFRSTIESASLQLMVDCPPLPEPVYIDREMWEKIVLNLLSNAFKFTFTGSISVALKQRTNQVELTISDTGTGIPAQDLPHLFERFYQVKGAQGRSYEGSGIGLALVQELVKCHSGTITATSEPNQGTRFTITLPTGHAHLLAAEINLSSPQTATTNGIEQCIAEASRWLPGAEVSSPHVELELRDSIQDLGSPTARPLHIASSTAEQIPARVLIVDDNADMRDYLSRLLHQQYQVEAVNDGLAALRKITQQKPDLILTDVMMPRMDGLQLLRSLRENAQTQDIPLILLSARAGETAKVAGLAAGADDYLIKPFTARELLARIDAHLKLARMRREVAAQAQMMQTIQTLNERLEQRVIERTTQLQDLNQELEAFAYSVSHDLRTPLRYISSFAEQLRSQLDANPPKLTASPLSILRIIQRSALAAEQMVDDLLAFSRSSQSEMYRTLVPLDILVKQVQDQLQPETVGRQIQWQIASLPTVNGDPTLLQLVLQNLLSNAIKYTRERNPAEISINSWETETEYMIAVRDNGAGFDMKYSDRLFQLFQRLHTQEAFAGTGVGLANVRRIIHRHGGRTWAEGEIDQGATFYFTIPK